MKPSRHVRSVRWLVLHAGTDVSVFGSDQTGVGHFSFYFHWLKSWVLCTICKKGEAVLVLEVPAHVLQIGRDVHWSPECEVVSFAAGFLCEQIQASLCEVRAQQA